MVMMMMMILILARDVRGNKKQGCAVCDFDDGLSSFLQTRTAHWHRDRCSEHPVRPSIKGENDNDAMSNYSSPRTFLFVSPRALQL
jgi:hypothetical protein